MIFNEIYSCYYNAIAKIIKMTIEGKLNEDALGQIIEENAFDDSLEFIRKILKGEEKIAAKREEKLMPLLYVQEEKTQKKWTTPIVHVPEMPLTLLQKRWMKALLSDPRVALFGLDDKGLEEIEPLFSPDTFVYFDRNNDGDPYTDPIYIANFRRILAALHEQKNLWVEYQTQSGKRQEKTITPHHLEYSEKDDCFRLFAGSEKGTTIILLAKIREITIDSSDKYYPLKERERKALTMLLNEDSSRNVLERFMIAFSHFEKEAKRLNHSEYQIKIKYDADEEKDVLIRILGFGPYIKVTEPKELAAEIGKRLYKQLTMFGSTE